MSSLVCFSINFVSEWFLKLKEKSNLNPSISKYVSYPINMYIEYSVFMNDVMRLHDKQI